MHKSVPYASVRVHVRDVGRSGPIGATRQLEPGSLVQQLATEPATIRSLTLSSCLHPATYRAAVTLAGLETLELFCAPTSLPREQPLATSNLRILVISEEAKLLALVAQTNFPALDSFSTFGSIYSLDRPRIMPVPPLPAVTQIRASSWYATLLLLQRSLSPKLVRLEITEPEDRRADGWNFEDQQKLREAISRMNRGLRPVFSQPQMRWNEDSWTWDESGGYQSRLASGAD